MQHNETGAYTHSRPPPPGGQGNPSATQLSGLTSPSIGQRQPHLQQHQHGPQQQLRYPQTNQPNQFTMRSQQPEKVHQPYGNNSQAQPQQLPYRHQQQQHFHQHRQVQQERQHLFQNFANSPQQHQHSGNNSNSNSNSNLLNNNNSDSISPSSKSQTLSSPTRRLDISSSPNSSPHSTMDSKKSRSRSTSQSTPGKSGLAIKRSEDAPVTLQGWLYKQGSDGLMLWKKRWFVLSEFCLFYYKGPDEDRCSGSILLPSYKISPVSKEDGIYRKFAFKAEHQNMRTYFFAAESKESMSQWMNALSLASICQQEQNFQHRSPNSNLPIVLSPSGQASRFSPRQNYPQTTVVQHHYPPAVHQMYSPNGNAYLYQPKNRHSARLDSSEADDDNVGTRQPLYANAPPKPKRLNTSRDRESPSPERLVYQVTEENTPPLVTAMYQHPHAGVHKAHVIDENTPQSYRHRLPQERRTPEVYGRAAFFNSRQQPGHAGQINQPQTLKQYEDLYNANNKEPYKGNNYNEQPRFHPPPPPPPQPHHQQQYNIPQNQHGYHQPNTRDFNRTGGFNNQPPYQNPSQTLPNGNRFLQQQPQQQPQQHQTHDPSVMMRQSRTSSSHERVPRPHSADFLEYERQFEPNTSDESGLGVGQSVAPQRGQAAHHRHPNRNNQPPRPKSSIDQRISSEVRRQMFDQQTDEERFMRMNSTTPTPRVNNNYNQQQQFDNMNRGPANSQIRNQAMNSRPPPPSATRHPPLTPQMRERSQKIQYNDPQNAILDATNEEILRYFPTPSPRKPLQNAPSTYQNVPVPPSNRPQMHRLESVTPNRLVSDYAEEQQRMADEAGGEFRRSSSARLHRNKRNHSDIFDQLNFGHEETRKKEQREESMKRLLEWKQRMLQSPLTRKSSRNASRTQTPTNSSSPVPSLNNNNEMFRQKVLQELERSGESTKSVMTSSSAAQTPAETRRVSRKGSGASRSSRNRSSPRISNRPTTSSSDEDVSEASRDSRQYPRRKTNSTNVTKKDSNNFKPKVRGNLLDLTAQDLLGKNHEELVLMLIHLRRQSAALNEAIDASRAELQNLANNKTNSTSDDEDSSGNEHRRNLMGDLRGHIKDLEEKRARGLPIISLVDNMVKLGSLYRGPQDAPLSHRVRNIPVEKSHRPSIAAVENQQSVSKQRRGEIQKRLEELYQIELAISQEAVNIKYLCRDHQDLLERSLHMVNKTMNDEEGLEKIESGDLAKQQQILVHELDKVRSQLQNSQMKLDDVASQHAHWEHDILILRQQLQTSASRDMQYGLGQSAETLNIESELAHVHQQANELHRRRTLLSREIEALTQKQDILCNEIRPSPTGVAGAEPIPSRKKKWTPGWVETDLDSMVSIDWAKETEAQVKKEKNSASQNLPVYVNTYEEEDHSYENFMTQTNVVVANNPYEDDVQTVHSEGVRSEMEPPPIPSEKRPNGIDNDDSITTLTLGDISEADDRVKKFYGILPRDNIKEIKTVRMVKRDSKERSVSKIGPNVDDDDDQGDDSYMGEEPPPPPLPRGNYQNLHDFLTPKGNQAFGSLTRTTSGRIRYTEPDDDGSMDGNQPNGTIVNGKTSTLPKTNFKLGEYYKRKYSKDSEKQGNGISAHERLFGSSRETSLSPPSSPEKSFSSSRVSSSTSPITSPIFKSATAKAIIEEVGKNLNGTDKKRSKKRSLTITSSHPAVMEALNDHHARMLQGSARSRDDLDMEQALRPRGQNTPDVIRSALDKNDTAIANVSTIDNLFGAPDKIVIPERYIPDTDMDNQTPEERKVRLKKVDSIRRMLAGQPAAGEASHEGDRESLTEERKQREQLLELNHLIARQVMEKSRMVAGKSQQS